MKIAVSSQDRATITDHTGPCHRFWIYETVYAEVVRKQLIELAGRRIVPAGLPKQLGDINVLITGGLASDLRYRLKQRGIQTVTTLENDPDRAVTAWLHGTLDEMPPLSQIGHDAHVPR